MKTRYIIALAASTLALVGCQREEIVGPEVLSGKDGIVKFAPGVGGIVSNVKSSASEDASATTYTQPLTLMSEDGGFTLPMDLSVTSLETGDGTKATLINENGGINDAEFATAISNTFWVAAWDNAATPARIIPDAYALDEEHNKFKEKGYISGDNTHGYYQKVSYRDGVSSTHYWMTVQPQTSTASGAPTDADDEYIWKKISDTQAETKTFYAYANAPAGDVTFAQVNNEGTLKQTMTGTGIPTQDILMGYYRGIGTSGDPAVMTGTASIQFHHPLAAVKFVQGEISPGVEITGVTIKKVYTGSWCVKQEGHGFTWTKDGTNVITADDATGTLPMTWDGEQHVSGNTMVIPQNFPALACISIKINDESLTVYSEIGGWEPGKLYTYTIGYSLGDMDIMLKGDFSASEIKDVVCYNDGGINAFVRAMVVANWVDASGNVQSTCDWTTEGTLVSEDGTLWIKGADGFYYYKKAIKSGSTTKTRLIKSYKPASVPTGADGLEFKVYTQGIKYDELAKVKEQWPELPEGVEKSLEQ